MVTLGVTTPKSPKNVGPPYLYRFCTKSEVASNSVRGIINKKDETCGFRSTFYTGLYMCSRQVKPVRGTLFFLKRSGVLQLAGGGMGFQ